ncbi:hypothetical protein B0H11DRAFT_1933512 [Mycena galericulata]|nr:hypothetical protein B0H11DRAFT_1933512 [Mycena galericulata]
MRYGALVTPRAHGTSETMRCGLSTTISAGSWPSQGLFGPWRRVVEHAVLAPICDNAAPEPALVLTSFSVGTPTRETCLLPSSLLLALKPRPPIENVRALRGYIILFGRSRSLRQKPPPTQFISVDSGAKWFSPTRCRDFGSFGERRYFISGVVISTRLNILIETQTKAEDPELVPRSTGNYASTVRSVKGSSSGEQDEVHFTEEPGPYFGGQPEIFNRGNINS